jgi:hypothetical protein
MENKKPDWLEETDDGVNITLSKPLNIDGAKVTALSMREPSVNDQLISAKIKGEDADREVALFANLCTITPEQVKNLKLRDYKRLQTAYVSFID